MHAALLDSPGKISQLPLRIEEVPSPALSPGHVLLRVRACGVCRTDLHIVEGELPPRRQSLIPGHQIVGEIVDGGRPDLPFGMRVGVSWMGGVDGTCWYCRSGLENLCDAPTFTGYTVNGGYAESALVRADFVFPLPQSLDDLEAAPLLCAGIIGFRSLRVAEVAAGEPVLRVSPGEGGIPGIDVFGIAVPPVISTPIRLPCTVFADVPGLAITMP